MQQGPAGGEGEPLATRRHPHAGRNLENQPWAHRDLPGPEAEPSADSPASPSTSPFIRDAGQRPALKAPRARGLCAWHTRGGKPKTSKEQKGVAQFCCRCRQNLRGKSPPSLRRQGAPAGGAGQGGRSRPTDRAWEAERHPRHSGKRKSWPQRPPSKTLPLLSRVGAPCCPSPALLTSSGCSGRRQLFQQARP